MESPLIIALIAGSICAMMSLLLLFRFRWSSGGPVFWILKSFSTALAPIFFTAGLFCAVIGIIMGSNVAIVYQQQYVQE